MTDDLKGTMRKMRRILQLFGELDEASQAFVRAKLNESPVILTMSGQSISSANFPTGA